MKEDPSLIRPGEQMYGEGFLAEWASYQTVRLAISQENTAGSARFRRESRRSVQSQAFVQIFETSNRLFP